MSVVHNVHALYRMRAVTMLGSNVPFLRAFPLAYREGTLAACMPLTGTQERSVRTLSQCIQTLCKPTAVQLFASRTPPTSISQR